MKTRKAAPSMAPSTCMEQIMPAGPIAPTRPVWVGALRGTEASTARWPRGARAWVRAKSRLTPVSSTKRKRRWGIFGYEVEEALAFLLVGLLGPERLFLR